MELSKQEMEIFLLFPDLRSKNFFYKMFLTFTNDFKIGFQIRKLNYFSCFLTSNQKKSNTKCLQLFPKSSKLVLRTGTELYKKGNWNNFLRSEKFVQN